jgi:acyl-CoA synthetase (AMP-forming)/AMP-acid ligase II
VNFKALLQWSATRHHDRLAVVFGETERTYAEVWSRATRLANGLRELGVRKGDRVLICLGNRAEHFDLDVALAQLGAIKAPVLTGSTVPELERYLVALEPAAVVAGPAAVDRAREACGRVIGSALVVLDDPDPGEFLFEDLVQGSASAPIDVDIRPSDPYAIRLTGGTTGHPKGVLMDHRCAVTMTNNLLLNLPVSREDVFLSIHPLSHACGNISGSYWARGATNAILPDFSFSAQAFVDAAERWKVTSTFMIPTVLNVLLDADVVSTADLSGLELIIYGGQPIPMPRLLQAIDRFGPVFAQIYGSTESPMFTVALLPEEHVFSGPVPDRLRSAGRAILNAEVRVMNDCGEVCAANEVGELQSRGDHTMTGYWGNDELTARRKIDDWVLTGDLGYTDENGYIYLVDRREDVVKTGGFNVWPAEVEDVIYGHPDVREAAVFGIPDDHWGEMLVATAVVENPTEATEAGILAFVAERLVKYKVPKRIVVRSDPLPQSETGKILRRQARDQELARRRLTPTR